MRVIQVSDTHLSASHEHFSKNNRAVTQWLSTQQADLIVHTGDLGMDCAGTLEDLHLAADWMSGFASELVCVPGNHDVGDRIAVKPSQPVNDARLAQWRDVIGPDYWSLDQGGWRLMGLNAMLFDTAHPAEEQQFAWLEATLSTRLPVAIFLHKPLFVEHPDEGRQVGRTTSTSCHGGRDGRLRVIGDHQVMSASEEPLRHVGAHPAHADHAELHR